MGERARQGALYAALAAVALGLEFGLRPLVADSSLRQLIMTAAVNVLIALSLNIINGMAGQFSIGHAGFVGVGAYTAAVVMGNLHERWPGDITFVRSLALVPVSVGSAAALSALCGLVVGLPSLRLRGDYLAIVTLGFGEIIRIFMNNLNAPVNITNGPQGINLIDPIRIFGVSLAGEAGSNATVHIGGFSMPSVNAYYFLFLGLCAAIIFVSIRLQHSRLGRAWVAIREDEIAAKAMGINTRNIKLLAFAMGASFGGVSGAMFASFQGFVSPESFSLMESIAILAMVVLGGIGHIPGVVLGGAILAALPEVLRHVVEPMQQQLFGTVLIEAEVLRQLLYGLAMVVIMLYRPAGIWPSPMHEDRMDANATKRHDEKEPTALAA